MWVGVAVSLAAKISQTFRASLCESDHTADVLFLQSVRAAVQISGLSNWSD